MMCTTIGHLFISGLLPRVSFKETENRIPQLVLMARYITGRTRSHFELRSWKSNPKTTSRLPLLHYRIRTPPQFRPNVCYNRTMLCIATFSLGTPFHVFMTVTGEAPPNQESGPCLYKLPLVPTGVITRLTGKPPELRPNKPVNLLNFSI